MPNQMKKINVINSLSLILIFCFTIIALITQDVIYRHLFTSLLFVAFIGLIKVNSTSKSNKRTNEQSNRIKTN